MRVKPVGMVPCAMVTLSAIEPTSPPPPPVAVVEAMACAVSSYCARVGVLDDVHAANDRTRGSNAMRFMGPWHSKPRTSGTAGGTRGVSPGYDSRRDTYLDAPTARTVGKHHAGGGSANAGYGEACCHTQVRTSSPSVAALVRSSSQRRRSSGASGRVHSARERGPDWANRRAVGESIWRSWGLAWPGSSQRAPVAVS